MRDDENLGCGFRTLLTLAAALALIPGWWLTQALTGDLRLTLPRDAIVTTDQGPVPGLTSRSIRRNSALVGIYFLRWQSPSQGTSGVWAPAYGFAHPDRAATVSDEITQALAAAPGDMQNVRLWVPLRWRAETLLWLPLWAVLASVPVLVVAMGVRSVRRGEDFGDLWCKKMGIGRRVSLVSTFVSLICVVTMFVARSRLGLGHPEQAAALCVLAALAAPALTWLLIVPWRQTPPTRLTRPDPFIWK